MAGEGQKPDTDGGEGDVEIAGRHLFSAGMDPAQAEDLLGTLLSDDPEFRDGPGGDEEENRGTGEGDSKPAPKAEPREPEDEYEDFDEVVEEDDDLDEDEYEDFEDFGGEEDDDEDLSAEGGLEPGELVTVKVDGETHEVTLDELKAGFSFRAHNTRVSQELAQERQTLEEEAAAVREERKLYGERLDQLEQALQGLTPEEPDWDALKKEDPQRYLLVRDEWDQHQARLRAIAAEKERLTEEEQKEALTTFQKRKAAEADKLVEAIPEWMDHDRARAELGSIKRAAISTYGYTDDELRGMIDHRGILVLRDALRYRKMKSKGRETVEGKRKKRGGTKVKPGSRARRKGPTTKAARRAAASRRRLAETGRIKDAERTIFDALPEDF